GDPREGIELVLLDQPADALGPRPAEVAADPGRDPLRPRRRRELDVVGPSAGRGHRRTPVTPATRRPGRACGRGREMTAFAPSPTVFTRSSRVTIEPGTSVRRSPRAEFRRLENGTVGVWHLDTGQYHGLNEVGAAIWDLADGRSLEQIVDGLRHELDDPPD